MWRNGGLCGIDNLDNRNGTFRSCSVEGTDMKTLRNGLLVFLVWCLVVAGVGWYIQYKQHRLHERARMREVSLIAQKESGHAAWDGKLYKSFPLSDPAAKGTVAHIQACLDEHDIGSTIYEGFRDEKDGQQYVGIGVPELGLKPLPSSQENLVKKCFEETGQGV